MPKFHTHDFDFLPELAFRRGEKGRLRTLEGGKGSAQAPNPMLEVMQMQAMQNQSEATGRMLSLQEQFAPLQQEQMRLGLDATRTAYQQSQDDRAYALGKRGQLDAAMQPLLDDARDFDEGTRRAELMREANADISMAFGSAQDQQARGLARQGVTVNSGRSQAMGQQAELAEAAARSAAGRKVSDAAKAEGLALRSNAVNMLGGFPAMATGLTGAGASYGSAGVGLTNAGVGGMTSGYGQAAQAYGSLAGAAGKAHESQQTAYNNVQAANAQNSGQVWGTVAGAAMMMLSDRRAKTDIKRVGKTDDNLPIYTYRYKGDDVTQMGVMADEVEKVKPKAVGRVGGLRAVDYSKI